MVWEDREINGLLALEKNICYDGHMRREAWSMSARLAWHRPTFRVLTILLILFVTLSNGVYLLKTVPVVQATSTVILHYNVYLGIDDVRPWPWVFLWPGVWMGASFAGILAAMGVYQRDALLAYGLLSWLLAWSVPWAMGLFYLMTFNIR